MSNRTIIWRSALWAVFCGLAVGIGAFQSATPFDRVFVFSLRFLFFGSLIFVMHPRAMQWKTANEAGRAAMPNDDRREQKRLVKAASQSIGRRQIPPESSIRAAVYAMSGVLRKRPLFDQAALYLPCAWIGFFLLRDAFRLVDGRVGAAANGLLALVLPVFAIAVWWTSREKRAAASFVYGSLSDDSDSPRDGTR